MHMLDKTCTAYFLIFEQIDIFLSSARTLSSSRDFGVEQLFRADEFWADDPSPLRLVNNSTNVVEYWQHFIKGYKA